MTKEYGWKSPKAPCSCDYIAPKVLQILKHLGVSSILDVGCGNGALCGLLKREGYTVSGTDYDKIGCALAQKAHPEVPIYNVGVYDSPETILRDAPAVLIV